MVGAVVGNVIAAASRPSRDRPAPTLKIADTSGIAAAISEPNMNSSRMQRTAEADELGRGVARLLADLARAGAVLDLEAGRAGRRRRRC